MLAKVFISTLPDSIQCSRPCSVLSKTLENTVDLLWIMLARPSVCSSVCLSVCVLVVTYSCILRLLIVKTHAGISWDGVPDPSPQLTAPLTTVTLSHDIRIDLQAADHDDVSVLRVYELVVSVSPDAGKLLPSHYDNRLSQHSSIEHRATWKKNRSDFVRGSNGLSDWPITRSDRSSD